MKFKIVKQINKKNNIVLMVQDENKFEFPVSVKLQDLDNDDYKVKIKRKYDDINNKLEPQIDKTNEQINGSDIPEKLTWELDENDKQE